MKYNLNIINITSLLQQGALTATTIVEFCIELSWINSKDVISLSDNLSKIIIDID